MFSIERSAFGTLTKVALRNKKGTAICDIIPGFGANLIQLQLERNGKVFQLLEGFKNENQLRANEKSKGIHLVPFPNRIKDGRYVFEGKEYHLPINKPKENNAIHGFVWNRSFEIIGEACAAQSAFIKLEHKYNGDNEGYPFPFKVHYQYELTEHSLGLTVAVVNTGKTKMPLGIGWHPYFTFHKQAGSLELQLPSCNILETDERLIPAGARTPFDYYHSFNKIGNTSFDTLLQLTGKGNAFESRLRDPETGVEIVLQQDASLSYLQIYIPPDRNSIAVEPMTCPGNAFNSKEGLITLNSGEFFEAQMRISLSS